MFLHYLSIFLYILKHASGSPINPRRVSNTTTSIDVYIQQIRTTIYAIDQIRINSSTTACNDNTTEAKLNSTGLDGILGHLLLCEDASGVIIFPNITQAEGQLEVALSGLMRRGNGTSATNNTDDCKSMSSDALGQAGIDTDAVNALICDASLPRPTASNGIPWANSTAKNASSSAFARSMSSKAAVRLDVSIPLTADSVTTISPVSISMSSSISQPVDEQLALSIALTEDFSTNLSPHTATSIITTVISGAGPQTVTSTATAAQRDPRTVTVWQIVYVTAIQPTSSAFSMKIPLTVPFSTQLVPVHTVTMTTTTSVSSARTPVTVTSTASTSMTGRDPRTVTIWQVVYVTAM